jgi:hypothetical protein
MFGFVSDKNPNIQRPPRRPALESQKALLCRAFRMRTRERRQNSQAVLETLLQDLMEPVARKARQRALAAMGRAN